MKAYYDKRKPYMVKIWYLMIGAKIGNIAELFAVLYYARDRYAIDKVLSEHYPPGPDNENTLLDRHCFIVLAINLFGIMLLVVAVLLLKKNLSLARKMNPVLITVAFMIERPLFPVYRQSYYVLSLCGNAAMTFMVPWLVCETLLGQLASWTCIFATILTQATLYFGWSSFSPQSLISFVAVCFLVNLVIT